MPMSWSIELSGFVHDGACLSKPGLLKMSMLPMMNMTVAYKLEKWVEGERTVILAHICDLSAL